MLWEESAETPDNRLTAPLASLFDAIPDDWRGVTDAFRASASGRTLIERVDARRAAGATIFPADVFAALRHSPLHRVRVVILGQDPYHGPGQAHGLAFSVPRGVRVPPSLRNMLKERQRDLGLSPPGHGDLAAWADAGVLLLNTTLTVEAGLAASHAGWGWEELTDQLVLAVAADPAPKVFLLWGAHAQRKAPLIDGRHPVLMANHPSPLSATRGPQPFIGCGHFGMTTRLLAAEPPLLTWALDP